MEKYKNLIKDEEIVTDFAPICPHCGHKMVWGSDFMGSECGYGKSEYEMTEDELAECTDENGLIKDDPIIHGFSCPHCDCSQEYEDMEEDGKIALLSTSIPCEKDDPRELVIKYTDYAKKTYGMEDYEA